MRYDNCRHRYGDDFDPADFRMRTEYEPDMVIATYYHGLLRRRVRTFLGPVYGEDPGLIARVTRDNPADLLEATDLRPGELAMYVNYSALDNYNFDAQAESFAWLAARRGVAVEMVRGRRAPTTTSPTSRLPSRPPTAGWEAGSCRPVRR